MVWIFALIILLNYNYYYTFSEKCESKLPLLYSELILLCCRQLDCGAHPASVAKNILDFVSILSPLALGQSTTWFEFNQPYLWQQFKKARSFCKKEISVITVEIVYPFRRVDIYFNCWNWPQEHSWSHRTLISVQADSERPVPGLGHVLLLEVTTSWGTDSSYNRMPPTGWNRVKYLVTHLPLEFKSFLK